MNAEDAQQHVAALSQYADEFIHCKRDLEEVRVKRGQLRAIRKSIAQLQKSGVPVPEALEVELAQYEAETARLQESPGDVVAVFEDLLSILIKLGMACRRSAVRELIRKTKERKAKAVPARMLREAILDVLKSNGNKAHRREVMAGVERRLAGQFSEVDLERPKGRQTRWQQGVERERKSMIVDGILTQDSKTVWQLLE